MSDIDDLVEEIDQKIQEIEESKAWRKVEEELKPRIEKLRGARRALLGTGNKLTGNDSGKRLTQAEVVDWMKRKGEPGTTWSLKELSEGLGFSQEVAVRVAGGADGATVDMRSTSLSAFPDFGENGQRVEAFLLELDNQVTLMLRNAPAQPAATD